MKSSFEVLNQILKGEHIAIEQYQEYIDSLPSSPLRNHMVSIVTDHKNHASRLAYFIQTNGGKASEGTGLVGTLSILGTKLKNLGEIKPLDMIDELYSGEHKGLAKAKELASEYLSGSEKEILASIFNDEENHLKQLIRLKEDLVQ